jgi:PEGA domain
VRDPGRFAAGRDEVWKNVRPIATCCVVLRHTQMMDEPYRVSATPEHDRELALAKRLDELRGTDQERAELEAQLRDLQALAQKRRLQLLGSVNIAAPCPANWSAMQGDNTQRFCGSCDKHVYNLSAMTEVQAARFIETQKSACVRFYQRADGTILTQDCPVGIKIRKRRNRIKVALAAGIGLAGAMGVASASMRARPTCAMQSGPAIAGSMMGAVGHLEQPSPRPPGFVPPEVSPEARGSGQLTLDTYPWTRVSIDGRSVGNTPIIGLSLPAGKHTVTMENTEEHISRSVELTIEVGRPTDKRFSFDK